MMTQLAKLPLETMNKVLGVLGNMPYGQVAELIAEVRSGVEIEEVEVPEVVEEKKD
jgi:hypothetical protein